MEGEPAQEQVDSRNLLVILEKKEWQGQESVANSVASQREAAQD